MTLTQRIAVTGTKQKPERRLGLTVRGWTIALAAVVILLVEFAPRLGWVEPFMLPPLSSIVTRLTELLGDGEFWTATILPSMLGIAIAFIAAAIAGMILGLIIWQWRPLRAILEPWLTVYYAIPLYALYPILVVIFGLGLVPIVTIGFSLAVVSVITATLDGLDAIPDVTLRLMKALRLTPRQRATKVLIPSALQQIGVGLRLAMSFSIIGVLASEFILSTYGLGYFISYSFDQFGTVNMYAGILFVILFAVLVNWVGGLLLQRQKKKTEG